MSICFCEKKWLEACLKNSGAIVSAPTNVSVQIRYFHIVITKISVFLIY